MDKHMDRLEISKVFHNRYLILSIIGKGGMGTVYLAQDLRLKGKLWAIKEILVKEENYKKFAVEAKILVALDHLYLPKIVDYYPPNLHGHSYLVMDYIQGQTLLKLFEASNKRMNDDKIMKYALQLCDLFDYLHNQQDIPIIYRDLKPSNIMIDDKDNIRLIDFGIARSYKEGKMLDTVQMGTLAFAAPEQFKDTQTDHRADIYSLGALIYYLMTEGQFYNHTQQPLNHLRKDISIELTTIIMRMLMEHQEERYQNIIDVKREISYVIQKSEIEIPETVTVETAKQSTLANIFDRETSDMYSNPFTSMPHKFISIINLSSRAGSTFISVNLAKYLSELKIPTRIIEMPFAPYIFDYIGLEQRLNKSMNEESLSYYSHAHVIYEDKRVERNKETIDEGIIWTVPDPRKQIIDKTKWTYNHMTKLLNSSRKANITILDIGDSYRHPSVEPLLDETDLILFIVDPMPSEMMTNFSFADEFLKLNENSIPVEFVINQWTSGVNQKELEKSFHLKPLTVIPSISTFFIHKAVYNCNIPYSLKEIRDQLKLPFYSISKKIISKELLHLDSIEGQRGKHSLLKRWFIRG